MKPTSWKTKNRGKVISIIIVNWNAGQQLRDCISSIGRASHDGFILSEVVVVDNGSKDDSLDGIEKMGVPVTVVRNSINRGFAAACNQGTTRAKGDYLLFLNPDTVLFEDSLTRPIEFMERKDNASIGICGIKLLDEQGSYSTSCARFPSARIFLGAATGLSKLFPRVFPRHLMSGIECKNGGVVDQVIGAFFLVRAELFNKLNGFDERFFVYFEEVDFSLRAKRLGYSSYLLTGATAFHKGGGCTDAVKAARLFYSLRSRLQYGKKHFSAADNIGLIITTIFVEFGTRVSVAVLALSSSQMRETLGGYGKLFGYLMGRGKNGNQG
ncbi:MAG: putative glycosyltransferase [Candidatus Gallionella acididurans]|uniref:Putative glycosyltransferase n=1 Tax=Candidatus Gallionella acididurans TaxID=1796491 RepID=A0A139BP86_9PROT|nr:MAG: putative glycosyltransferase [Candidatus Gallionella acididurans]